MLRYLWFICTGTGVTVVGAQRFTDIKAKWYTFGILHSHTPNMDDLNDSLQFFFDDLTYIRSLLAKGEDPSAQDNLGKSLNDIM